LLPPHRERAYTRGAKPCQTLFKQLSVAAAQRPGPRPKAQGQSQLAPISNRLELGLRLPAQAHHLAGRPGAEAVVVAAQ
jgi:hypothetical protein